MKTELKTPKKFKLATVAIVGRPNAGKSTLINALLETDFSAVSKRPQTTRTNIRGVLQRHNSKKEWVGQLIFIDTPGLNFKRGLLDRSMYSAVEGAMKEVDIYLWVADVKTFVKDPSDIEKKRPGSDKIPAWLLDRLTKNKEGKWILVLNKMDQLDNPNELLPLMKRVTDAGLPFDDIVPLSAIRGRKRSDSNMDNLLDVLAKFSSEGIPLFSEEEWTDMSEKQLIQNLVREAIFRQCREELPYEADCSIEKFTDPEGKKKIPEVDATIWVSKASLKPIVVGAKGSRIKEIGKAVRERYTQITGSDLILRLLVKVVDQWNVKESSLLELGYEST